MSYEKLPLQVVGVNGLRKHDARISYPSVPKYTLKIVGDRKNGMALSSRWPWYPCKAMVCSCLKIQSLPTVIEHDQVMVTLQAEITLRRECAKTWSLHTRVWLATVTTIQAVYESLHRGWTSVQQCLQTAMSLQQDNLEETCYHCMPCLLPPGAQGAAVEQM